MHLQPEGLMIGVQCQLMICRVHIRASRSPLQIFSTVNGSMYKLTFQSNFTLLSSFRLQFQSDENGLGGQISYQLSI